MIVYFGPGVSGRTTKVAMRVDSLGMNVAGWRADRGVDGGGGAVKVIGERLRLSASDVANFLACQHLIRLDLLARGGLSRGGQVDVGFLDLVARGEAHEQRYFRGSARRAGRRRDRRAASDAEAARATRQAIRDGADVIYQGAARRQEQRRDGGGAAGPAGLPDPGGTGGRARR